MAFVQSNGAGNTASATSVATTLPGAVVDGDTIIVGVTQGDPSNADTITVTDSAGNTYTAVEHDDDTTDHQSLWLFYATGVVGASSLTITASWATARGYRGIVAAEYGGALTLDVAAVHQATSSDATAGPITTTQDGDVVVGIVTDTSTGSSSLTPVGMTSRATSPTVPVNLADTTQATAGAITAEWTLAGANHYIAIVASFKTAVAVTHPFSRMIYDELMDADVQVYVTAEDDGYIDLFWRFDDTDNTGYLAEYESDTHNVNVYLCTGTGAFTILGLAGNIGRALVAGDVLGVEAAGDVHTVYLNGVALPTALTDATYNRVGKIGLGVGANVDNFGGGPVFVPLVPVNTAAPSVTGSSTVGDVLSGSDGAWDNAPTSYTRGWYRDGVLIAGTTGATTYTLVSADGGHAITFGVSATNAAGTSATAYSAPVTAQAVATPPPPPSGDSVAVVDLAGNTRAFLEPDDISVTRRWCGGSSLSATLDVQDPKVAELEVASTAIQLWMAGTLRFHGKVGEPLTSDEKNTTLVAGDPWDELTARKLTADETYTAEDGGAIAWALIAAENTRSNTRVRQGTVDVTANRTVTFAAGTSRADDIVQLSQLDGSFGFTLDPVADTPGTLAEFVARAGFSRETLDAVRFEYGDGTLDNCSGFKEELRRPRNRIIATGQSLADGTRPQAVAENTASQTTYGLWEYEVAVDTDDVAVLQAHADAELRPDPIAVYTLTPTADAPLLFRDFDVGHVVNLTIRWGRVDVTGTARVDECTIRRTTGDWLIESLTLSAPTVHRVTRAPDERFYALLGAYRDRIAVLERARVVGS